MKKSFMTRALATGLSLAMAFSLSAATNVTVASAASTPAMASKQFAVRVGGATKTYKASAATLKKFKITKATVGNTSKATVKVASSKKGIKVTPGTVAGSTVVKVTFKNSKTKKTTTKKYRCVVKAKKEDKLTMTAEAKGVKKIAVTFNKAVDPATAKIVVKKGAATPTIATTTYAADAKSAELIMGTKLTEGTYTVEVTSGTDVLTADITVQDEKLTSFELVSANLVASAKVSTRATVSYKALNQYGEMMAVNEPQVTCTFGTTESVTSAGVDKSGRITIAPINTMLTIPGTTGTIVLVDTSTGVNLNTTITYQPKAVAAEATVYGIYSTKTSKLVEGNLTTGAKVSDYAILMGIKDQYGSDMTPKDVKDSEAEVTFNAAPVLTDLNVQNTSVTGDETEVNHEGASAFLIPLKATGNKIEKAGTLSLTIVSAGKGVIANPTITVDEAKIIKTLSIAPASTIYAGEDNVITIEAYDAAGNAITKYDELKAANLVVKSGDTTLPLKKNADGTAKLTFKPTDLDSWAGNKNNKESTIATLICTANSATSTDYLVKTVNVTYYESRKIVAVAGKGDKTVTACASGSSLTLDLATLMYEDQYANALKYDGAVKVATDQISVIISDPKQVFTTAASNGTAVVATGGNISDIDTTTDTKGEKIVFKSKGVKGDATLYFRYGAEATDTKYDLKLTISATEVSDMVASDLKVVVNKGNAICASGTDVTLAKSDSNDPANHVAGGADAYVYVTGVVNGKTVIIPSSQYNLVTTKINKLGDKDENGANKNAKTVTQTVTVVVDSESGAQELTTDVTVSNLNPTITTVEAASNKGNLGTLGSKVVTGGDLIGAIKVKDQYGNEMTGQEGNFRYKFALTGTSANLDGVVPKGDSTQSISVDFTNAKVGNAAITADTEITATVTYTTMDGKITFTQDVKFKLTV